MTRRPLSSPLPRAGGLIAPAVLGAWLTLVAVGALAPAGADAKLIPPPGPWPTNVSGARNPLVGTAFVLNGGHATRNAELRVWLPSGGKRATSITRTVGQPAVMRGRLRNRDSNSVISGATLIVAVQNVYTTLWTAIGNVRTNRRGNFHAIVPPGYHRRAAVLYYPTVLTTSPIFSSRLLIRAKSRVKLARPYGKRRAYRFDGRVSAGAVPIPAAGLLVALQVRNRNGNWVTARLRRTTASGRFRIRYTFPRSSPLKLRVAAPSQSGWPLYAGYSRTWPIRPR